MASKITARILQGTDRLQAISERPLDDLANPHYEKAVHQPRVVRSLTLTAAENQEKPLQFMLKGLFNYGPPRLEPSFNSYSILSEGFYSFF